MKSLAVVSATAVLAGLASAAPASGSGPEFYLIRHAEKNSDGTISAQGKRREQCLVKLFGKGSKYNIQHIMTQNPYPNGAYSRLHTSHIRLPLPALTNEWYRPA